MAIDSRSFPLLSILLCILDFNGYFLWYLLQFTMEFIKVAYKRISHFDLLYGNKEALELLIAYSDFDEYIYACNEAASFLLLFFCYRKQDLLMDFIRIHRHFLTFIQTTHTNWGIREQLKNPSAIEMCCIAIIYFSDKNFYNFGYFYICACE